MDKAQGFISDDAMNGLLWLTEHDRTPTWLELDRFIRALGYRKLPEGEPPLINIPCASDFEDAEDYIVDNCKNETLKE